MSICVVVADGSRARLLLAEHGDSALIECSDLVHPESRLRQQQLVSDSPGSGNDSGGYGSHSMGHENTAHRKQEADFARELSSEIDRLCDENRPHRLYLVAPPRFLGELRGCLSKQSSALLAGEIDKNLVKHGIDEIRAHLPKRM